MSQAARAGRAVGVNAIAAPQTLAMFGLYVHVPFCARRCPYCDFAIHVGAGEDFVAQYVAALHLELKNALEKTSRSGREFTSIFFGGGTPTFLEGRVLASLLIAIREQHSVAADAEITIEANPENLDSQKLQMLRDAGFNRLSLGVQSLDDEALRYLGRVHRAADVEAAVSRARHCGWHNISLDLIYAVPQQSRDAWRRTLERSAQLPVTHVSCYSLTIENDTHFGKRAAKGLLLPVHDDIQAEQMQDAQETLEAAGLARYEISNYARPGFESRHNQNYWRCGDYLAAGCGAHGHLNGVRWWNQRNAQEYVEEMKAAGSARSGEEQLTPRQRLDEMVMLGLRTREGFSLEDISQTLGIDAESTLGSAVAKLIAEDWLERRAERILLTPQGVPVADAITAKLLA